MKTHTLEAGQLRFTAMVTYSFHLYSRSSQHFIPVIAIHCDGHILISFVFPQFTAFHSSVWVFIAQLGEHCSANAETTGSNPVEAPKIFFSGYFRNCLNCDSLRWSHTHFICIPAVHSISFSVSFLSRVDELNKLASLQCMGLHSSAGRALQR